MTGSFVQRSKILLIFFLISISVLVGAQQIPLNKFLKDENLREELVLVDDYIKEVRRLKVISDKPIFIRFEAGEAAVGEVLTLRFMGNYYRNIFHKKELYFQSTNNIYYIFDIESIKYLEDKIDFLLIKDNYNLKDYGVQNTDLDGIGLDMGELIFDKSCSKYYLAMAGGLPCIEIYFKIKF